MKLSRGVCKQRTEQLHAKLTHNLIIIVQLQKKKKKNREEKKLSHVISLVLAKAILGQVINLNGLMGDSWGFDWLAFFQPIKQRERESDRSLQAWLTVNAATPHSAEHSSKMGCSLSSLSIIIDVVNSSIAVRLVIKCKAFIKAGQFYTVSYHNVLMLIKLCVIDKD